MTLFETPYLTAGSVHTVTTTVASPGSMTMTEPTANPSNLAPPFFQVIGSQVITVDWALMQWSDNPFIPETPQWHEFRLRKTQQVDNMGNRHLKLPEVPITGFSLKRRVSTNPYRYDGHEMTLHDIRLRLSNTIIWIGRELFYVRDVTKAEGRYLLLLQDKERNTKRAWLDHPDLDLRTPDPQYLFYHHQPMFFFRRPERQQRQGLSNHCITLKYLGRNERLSGNTEKLMEAFDVEDIPWEPKLFDLMKKLKALRSIRLNAALAVYLDEDKELKMEYKGRFLGTVHDNCVDLDEDDRNKRWVLRELQSVGCEPR